MQVFFVLLAVCSLWSARATLFSNDAGNSLSVPGVSEAPPGIVLNSLRAPKGKYRQFYPRWYFFLLDFLDFGGQDYCRFARSLQKGGSFETEWNPQGLPLEIHISYPDLTGWQSAILAPHEVAQFLHVDPDKCFDGDIRDDSYFEQEQQGQGSVEFRDIWWCDGNMTTACNPYANPRVLPRLDTLARTLSIEPDPSTPDLPVVLVSLYPEARDMEDFGRFVELLLPINANLKLVVMTPRFTGVPGISCFLPWSKSASIQVSEPKVKQLLGPLLLITYNPKAESLFADLDLRGRGTQEVPVFPEDMENLIQLPPSDLDPSGATEYSIEFVIAVPEQPGWLDPLRMLIYAYGNKAFRPLSDTTEHVYFTDALQDPQALLMDGIGSAVDDLVALQTTCKAFERLSRGSFTAWDESEWNATEHTTKSLSWLRDQTIHRQNQTWVSAAWDIVQQRLAENVSRHIIVLTSSEFPEIPGQLLPGLSRGKFGHAALVPPHDWMENPTSKQAATLFGSGYYYDDPQPFAFVSDTNSSALNRQVQSAVWGLLRSAGDAWEAAIFNDFPRDPRTAHLHFVGDFAALGSGFGWCALLGRDLDESARETSFSVGYFDASGNLAHWKKTTGFNTSEPFTSIGSIFKHDVCIDPVYGMADIFQSTQDPDFVDSGPTGDLSSLEKNNAALTLLVNDLEDPDYVPNGTIVLLFADKGPDMITLSQYATTIESAIFERNVSITVWVPAIEGTDPTSPVPNNDLRLQWQRAMYLLGADGATSVNPLPLLGMRSWHFIAWRLASYFRFHPRHRIGNEFIPWDAIVASNPSELPGIILAMPFGNTNIELLRQTLSAVNKYLVFATQPDGSTPPIVVISLNEGVTDSDCFIATKEIKGPFLFQKYAQKFTGTLHNILGANLNTLDEIENRQCGLEFAEVVEFHQSGNVNSGASRLSDNAMKCLTSSSIAKAAQLSSSRSLLIVPTAASDVIGSIDPSITEIYRRNGVAIRVLDTFLIPNGSKANAWDENDWQNKLEATNTTLFAAGSGASTALAGWVASALDGNMTLHSAQGGYETAYVPCIHKLPATQHMHILLDLDTAQNSSAALSCLRQQIGLDTTLAQYTFSLSVSQGEKMTLATNRSRWQGLEWGDIEPDAPCGFHDDRYYANLYGDGTPDWLEKSGYSTAENFPNESGQGLALLLEAARAEDVTPPGSTIVLYSATVPGALSSAQRLIDVISEKDLRLKILVPSVDETSGLSRWGAWLLAARKAGLDGELTVGHVNPSGYRIWNSAIDLFRRWCRFDVPQPATPMTSQWDEIISACGNKSLDLGVGMDFANRPGQIRYVRQAVTSAVAAWRDAGLSARSELWGWKADATRGGICRKIYDHQTPESLATFDTFDSQGLYGLPMDRLNVEDSSMLPFDEELKLASALVGNSVKDAPTGYHHKCFFNQCHDYWEKIDDERELRIQIILDNNLPHSDIDPAYSFGCMVGNGVVIVFMETALSSDRQNAGEDLAQQWVLRLPQLNQTKSRNQVRYRVNLVATSAQNFVDQLGSVIYDVCTSPDPEVPTDGSANPSCPGAVDCHGCVKEGCTWCIGPDGSPSCQSSCHPLFNSNFCCV